MFGNNQAVGPEKADLYKAALERFVNQWKGNEIAARALYEWANVEYGQGNYVKAHTLADQGWDQYPASVGGIQCYNLIQQIEAKSASITTERVWNDPLPDIQVTYRNVTKVYFRAVSAKFEDYCLRLGWSPQARLNALLAAKPVLQWSADLPPQPTTSRGPRHWPPRRARQGLLLPDRQPRSFLHDGRTTKSARPPSGSATWRWWCATLAQGGVVEGFVLDAKSRRAHRRRDVTRWTYNSAKSVYQPADQTQSDSNGLFRFSTRRRSAIRAS